ncbi:MAG: DUF3332 family protein [Kiritimatiellae bacterium]|nr:DUF3332 family protein [Kiritimatiellia bacterium]
MKRLLVCALAGVMIVGTTACTGPFKLTKQLHTWNRNVENEWAEELVFLGLVIFPVYAICTLGDAIIFNSIEFWGGESPIASNLSQGDESVQLTYNADGTILLQSGTGSCVLQKTDGVIKALDTEGKVLYTAKTGADNKVRVYNADGAVVRTFDKAS